MANSILILPTKSELNLHDLESYLLDKKINFDVGIQPIYGRVLSINFTSCENRPRYLSEKSRMRYSNWYIRLGDWDGIYEDEWWDCPNMKPVSPYLTVELYLSTVLPFFILIKPWLKQNNALLALDHCNKKLWLGQNQDYSISLACKILAQWELYTSNSKTGLRTIWSPNLVVNPSVLQAINNNLRV